MTEDQVERIAERKMDALDARLLSGKLTQAEYDAAVQKLDEWVKARKRYTRPTQIWD